MELSNGMRKFLSGVVIIFILAIIVGGVFFAKTLFKSDIFKSVDSCADSAPGTFDKCCVIEGRGNRFDLGSQKCITVEPPVGNPSQLPLVQVTDANKNIIQPPTGQDSLIKPPGNDVPVEPVPVEQPIINLINLSVSNVTSTLNSLNTTNLTFNTSSVLEIINEINQTNQTNQTN